MDDESKENEAPKRMSRPEIIADSFEAKAVSEALLKQLQQRGYNATMSLSILTLAQATIYLSCEVSLEEVKKQLVAFARFYEGLLLMESAQREADKLEKFMEENIKEGTDETGQE